MEWLAFIFIYLPLFIGTLCLLFGAAWMCSAIEYLARSATRYLDIQREHSQAVLDELNRPRLEREIKEQQAIDMRLQARDKWLAENDRRSWWKKVLGWDKPEPPADMFESQGDAK